MHKLHLPFLMGYIIVFGIVFILSLYGLMNNFSVMDIGIGAKVTNITVAVLSFLGLGKALIHIFIS
jgi:hypothetical protein